MIGPEKGQTNQKAIMIKCCFMIKKLRKKVKKGSIYGSEIAFQCPGI